ncbi:helix-turn-helix domain-containing protein [Actinomyces sp.]|uniref:helix-turn-helix domain-containing protein n=1 Tax=Actinomyces sp. TaxID=29317 RepID=UPI0026DD6EF2|nr:helix-turn-helix domain-containing protein [Actinomyces sp.]MDO4899436.1 helix-turn-helix domain-containing protein [Actinomyces sp.]
MADTSGTTSNQEYMSPRDAAAFLQLPSVTARTLRNWARAGEIPVVVLPNGRLLFRRRDVEALLEPQVMGPEGSEVSGSSVGSSGVVPGQGALL